MSAGEDGCRGPALRPAPSENPTASSARPAATSSERTATAKWIFDLKEEDVFWCAADIGWVTGHSVVNGPLANGAPCRISEGALDTPARERFRDLVRRRGVTILYTLPTAIRAFMKWCTEGVKT